MKYFILIFASLILNANAYAGTITRDATPPQSVRKSGLGNFNVPSPVDLANAQYASNKDIQYMIEHYTTEEMAQYVININRQQRKTAMENKQPVPQKLTKEILSDKEKMGEYLRSLYRYKY